MKKKVIAVAIAAIIVLGAAGVLVSIFLKQYREKKAPSEVVMELSDYYAIPEGEAMVIIDETVYDKNALWRYETAYLDLETVTKMYIHRFFWSPEENLMIYTTPTEVFRFTPGDCNYTLNDTQEASKAPVIELNEGIPYIEITFLERCGITYSVYNNPNRVMITYSKEAFLSAEVLERTQIRVSQDIKADLLTTLEAGDKVRFIDGGGIRDNGFIKVMSSDGVRGYMLESALGESTYEDPVFVDFTWPTYSHLVYADKVYLGWQLLYTKDSIGYLNEALERAPEMNVIAPTWFYLTRTGEKGVTEVTVPADEAAGTEETVTTKVLYNYGFIGYANSDYVNKAHEKGVKVWATYKNDTIENKFDCSEDSHMLLSSSENRTRLIEDIMASVKEYNLDGINIDFEMLKVASGPYFVQFLRELSVKCRLKGVILSVDNYVPENYNAYYDLAEQSVLVDYIAIMGYDQHYAGSDEAGSVSSLDWFTAALDNTAAKADISRVIMGVPFYTRLWKIKDGGIYVEESPNMAEAEKKVKNAKAEKKWKEEAGQYYAEWKSGGATYKIWLEDEESLRAKTYASRERGVAGIAAWKCGDEITGTWAAIKDALEGELPAEEADDEASDDKAAE